ncbi:aldolase/citrate lyase family protein [Xanthobacteraceae bacterium Astr-EGSB]|uniref:HpcH/HpaI aldolase family protein n=1 Tax=Astrobacterium formosum TaxID=3069710 RepID=UPI0027B5E30C|nr:aldolase/citrate lyase family protein [Xanthobacteraceae bacterium Astr-EGSB]
MMVPKNALKARLAQGLPCFGTWLHSASPSVAEMVGYAGLDFAIIDLEHGPGDVDTARAMMQAMAAGGTTPMVRVPSGDPIFLKRVVDAGAQTLLIPMVDTAEEAKRIVDACLYPPRGQRGDASIVVRGSRYGLIEDYMAHAHEEMLIVPQIETVAAVAQAGAIAAVAGVDMVFIGPADLSGSAGLPGQTGAPEVERLIAHAVAAIRAAGKPIGTVPRDGKSWRDLFVEGYALVAAGCDLIHIRDAVLAQAGEWRRHLDESGRSKHP